MPIAVVLGEFILLTFTGPNNQFQIIWKFIVISGWIILSSCLKVKYSIQLHVWENAFTYIRSWSEIQASQS